MPILDNIVLDLNIEDLLKRQGYPERLRPMMEQMFTELLEEIKSKSLICSLAAYEIIPVEKIHTDKVSLQGGMEIQGTLIPDILPGIKQLALGVCTIGDRLENSVLEHSKAGDPLKATLLDGIGSAAVDDLAGIVSQRIKKLAAETNLQASDCLAPGRPEFPLLENAVIMSAVQAQRVGVELNSSMLLTPYKSCTIVAGIGTAMPEWPKVDKCLKCTMSNTCAYRMDPESADNSCQR